MIYTKTTENGIQKETPLTSLQMFCKCPECGKEIAMPGCEMLDLAMEFGDNFDFDSSSVYCDACTQERNRIRGQLHNVQDALGRMPLHKAAQLAELLKPYCNEQA